MHDVIEEKRDRVLNLGYTFNTDEEYRKIVTLWPDEAKHDFIREHVEWMTDPEGLKGPLRRQSQIAKCFDANGICSISPLKQLLRDIDKFQNCLADKQQKALNAVIPTFSIRACFRQAVEKSFILEFPDFPELLKGKYRETMRFLEQAYATRLPLCYFSEKLGHAAHYKINPQIPPLPSLKSYSVRAYWYERYAL